MKKLTTIPLLCCSALIGLITQVTAQQNVLVLQPNANQGKDSFITTKVPDATRGDHPDLMATAWTNSGNELVTRALIDFDFSELPAEAIIQSVKLSLYSYNSPSNGAHSTLSGSNESVLRRITSPWEEHQVSWNTQPTTTIVNQVQLEATTTDIQDFENIDITQLVMDMLEQPDSSYGLMLQLVNEQIYRRVLFASSDNPDSTLHPKLEINYSIPSGVQDMDLVKEQISIYPNPASDWLMIAYKGKSKSALSIKVLDYCGRLIKQQIPLKESIEIDVSDLTGGIYYIEVESDESKVTKKVIIK